MKHICKTILWLFATLLFPLSAFGVWTECTIDWADNEESNLFSYTVYAGDTQAGEYKARIPVAAPKSDIKCSDFAGRGLTEPATWYFEICAVNVDGAESAPPCLRGSTGDTIDLP